MEEAYVIGIRLALDNGISAGLAGITTELATLDRAIAGTTESLRLLSMLSPATQAAAGQTPITPQPAPATPAPPSDAPLPPSHLPQRQALPEITPSRAGQGPLPLSPVSRSVKPQLPSESPPSLPVAPSQPLPASVPPLILTPQSVAAPPATRVGPPILHFQLPSLEQPTLPTSPHILGPSPQPITAAPTSARAPRQDTALLPSTAPTRNQPISAAHPAAFAPSQPASPANLPAAPSLPPPFAAMPSAIAPQVAPQSPAAPHAIASSPAPTGGDVFLDGARVGHWLAQHLANITNRPPSGATGFDPRLGPVWPGTPQGGGQP